MHYTYNSICKGTMGIKMEKKAKKFGKRPYMDHFANSNFVK